MDTTELIKKVRAIEIKTRGLSSQIFSGEYHSAFKGRGMAFRENREYQSGDEIRDIDWNVTARMNHPFVKVFEEERELTAMVMVDMSASENFGSHSALKRNLITELTAVLAFSAMQNNDKIGALFFSDKIEKYIPPKKGKSHILMIIRELLNFTPEHKRTDIKAALKFFNGVVKKRCITFLISDFVDEGYEDQLKTTNRKHDLVALRVVDKNEMELPNVGLIKFEDAETGQTNWINTGRKSVRKKYAANALAMQESIVETMKKSGVDMATLSTEDNYVPALMGLFKKRGTR